MTIRDKKSIAHVEAVPVTDDYGMGTDINVPFASVVTAVELEEPATPIGAPYSFGMSATSRVSRTSSQTQRAAPMIQQQQHVVAQPPTQQQQQQHSGNHQHARRSNRNNQGCCNNQTCRCVTAWILISIFFIGILPFVIFLSQLE